MKEHIETITNLLLGAAYADKRLEGDEVSKIRDLLAKLLGASELPAAQTDQIGSFSPAAFNVHQAAASLKDLGDDRRRILEMIVAVHDADDELDFAEDKYLADVARGMGLSDEEYGDLTAGFTEIDELDGLLAD